jgi:hypothetical protein
MKQYEPAGTLTFVTMDSRVRWDAKGDITRDSWGNSQNDSRILVNRISFPTLYEET